ncbi:hypothetical protein SAMN05216298_0476 [Glycomyces sambucus]|uniref:Spheroidene monooxygenase n=1 Tax=Glycomyces sambucus TaxID=380244 RepID=A0A1G9CRJ9_9ACTN|nr:hypothetical protein [Glycomyces sambucus]SDK54282.1 hypothetical protein SAMN05216298_0476 [Glycomyces sambucus]
MSIHSFHLARPPLPQAVGALRRPPAAPGLRHMEVLAGMELGAPVVSPRRMLLRRLAVFAEWEDEAALEAFLAEDRFGRTLAAGWHVRLAFLRRWGSVRELDHLPAETGRTDPAEPVVAVTLARMRLPELPRFLHWGRPVERQVRDHPETTLALAAMRPVRTVATFSVWTSSRAMTGMVFGRGADAHVHHEAMAERERRDFHHEFTTMRFRPLSEHGAWQGRTGIVPGVRG